MNRQRLASLLLIPVAFLSVVPAIPILGKQAYDFYRSRGRFQTIGYVGLDHCRVGSILERFHPSQGGFQRAQLKRSDESHATIDVFRIDPETGAGADDDTPAQQYVIPPASDAPPDSYALFSDAHHLWFVSRNLRVFEWDDSQLVERESIPPLSHVNYNGGLRLLNVVHVIDGRLSAIIESAGYRRELFQLIDSHWRSQGEFQLLDTTRAWQTETGQTVWVPDRKPTQPDDQESSTTQSAMTESGNRQPTLTGRSNIGSIHILSVGSKSHLFWRVGSHWLCRQGIDLVPLQKGEDVSPLSADDSSVSAMDAENVIGIARGWSHVLDEAVSGRSDMFLVAVDGEPAVIVADQHDDRSWTAKALRPINGRWTEYCSINLPFQSSPFIKAFRADGSVSYLATVTGMGRTQTLSLDADGFHPTHFQHINSHDLGYLGYRLSVGMIAWALLIASISACLGDIALKHNPSDDTFGTLFKRGVSRVTDLMILVMSTGLIYILLRTIFGLDEITALEANMAHLKEHPQRILFFRILLATGICLSLFWLALVIQQGRTGLTPGKRIFKLRTLRTTLNSPGYTRSLLRELLVYADSAGFLCWSVGIVFMVLMQHRQRLGDLAADTIVIDTSSKAFLVKNTPRYTDDGRLRPPAIHKSEQADLNG